MWILQQTHDNTCIQISLVKFCCEVGFSPPKQPKDLDLPYKAEVDFGTEGYREGKPPSINKIYCTYPLSRMATITKSFLWNYAIIQVLPFLNNPKDLDLSYKMDLDFWECFGRKKLCFTTTEIG